MFKILSIAFLTLFIGIQSISAQSNVTIGSAYEEVRGKEKYFFDIDNVVYTVKIKDRTSVFVQKIEKSSLKETKKKLHSNILTDRAEILNILYANKKFYVFSIVETSKREFAIHGTIINQDNFEAAAKNEKLAEVKGGIHKPYYQKLGVVVPSPDGSKFLVKYYKPLPRDKENGITMGLHVYDAALKKIGGDEITMPFGSKEMDDMGISVDDDGTINVAGYNLEKEAYHLVKFNPNDLSHEIVSTPNKNFSYYNDFALDGVKNKYVAGFYDNEGTTQMYFIDLENSKEFAIDVPDELVPYYKDKGKVKNTLMVHNAYVQEDGGLLVIAQELYGVAMFSSWKNGTKKSRPSMSSLVYNDFFLVRTNSDGTLKWIKRVDKEDKLTMNSAGDLTADSPYLKNYKFYPRERYHLISKGGKHYFIFEDDKKEHKGKGMYVCHVDDESGMSTVRYGFGYKRIDKTKIYRANVKRTITLGENQIGAEVYVKKQGDAILKVDVK